MGAALLVAVIGAGWFHSRPLEKIGFAMDTSVRLVVFDRGSRPEVLEGAFDILQQVDKLMNVHREDSELSHLNREKELSVSPQLYEVIERGLYFARLTDGCFDITVRPLTELWDFKKEQVPTQQQIAQALPKVDWHNVTLGEEGRVQLHNGASLDLGGIAKGYAADCVAAYLKDRGVQNALIDIGGNVKAIGGGKNGFRIGLQNPAGQQGSYFATLVIREESVVSSGTYERNFTKDGSFYHHIIDPEKGRPLDNGIVASSVITQSGIDADALSTALMVMGPEEGIRLAQTLPGVECVLVDQDHRLFLTEGLQQRLHITLDTYQMTH